MPTDPAIVSATKHTEDYELVQRALDGNDAAVAQFESEYRPTLERVLMARGVDRGQAEDLVADVIAECFGAGKKGAMEKRLLEKFEGRSSLSTWLIRTTWNRWLDLKRRDKFRGELPEYDDDRERGTDRFDRVAAKKDEDFIETDLAELMASAIKQAFTSLDPEVLVMLKLSYLHGVSQTVIAQMWNCDQTRVSRALSSAREQIAAETMRAIKAADPDLEIDYDDFKKLAAYGIEF